jgi:hypothetical protein
MGCRSELALARARALCGQPTEAAASLASAKAKCTAAFAPSWERAQKELAPVLAEPAR